MTSAQVTSSANYVIITPSDVLVITSDIMQCMPMPVVANACLAYAQNLQCFGGHDEESVSKIICANFDLDAIKFARHLIFSYCAQSSEYVYNAPSDERSDDEKRAHAFEGIYSRLDLLRKGSLPPLVIACPSSDLHAPISEKLRSHNTANDIRLKKLEDSHADLCKTVMSIVNKSRATPFVSTPMLRARSPSVKRNRSMTSDVNDGFTLPKRQTKRRKKRSKSPAGKSDTDVELESNRSPTRVSKKHSFTWGKSEDTTAGFSGMVPDAFIYRCSPDTEAGVVKNHLCKRGLKIKTVELKSHKDASTKSFKVSVESFDDYELLLSGVHVPKCAKVRRYIHFKHRDLENTMLGRASNLASFPSDPTRHNDPMQVQRNYADNRVTQL